LSNFSCLKIGGKIGQGLRGARSSQPALFRKGETKTLIPYWEV
jgi:hypothetical protein